jgi:addiction module RelE/StbE family toxin
MKIKFARRFLKEYTRAAKNIQEAIGKRINLFRQDPFHPQLRNHPLSGKYSGYRSININGDWRAVYLEIESSPETIVSFEFLGTHSQLYK